MPRSRDQNEPKSWVFKQRRRHYLDGDFPIQRNLSREIDDSHAAFAQASKDVVPFDLEFGQWRDRLGRWGTPFTNVFWSKMGTVAPECGHSIPRESGGARVAVRRFPQLPHSKNIAQSSWLRLSAEAVETATQPVAQYKS